MSARWSIWYEPPSRDSGPSVCSFACSATTARTTTGDSIPRDCGTVSTAFRGSPSSASVRGRPFRQSLIAACGCPSSTSRPSRRRAAGCSNAVCRAVTPPHLICAACHAAFRGNAMNRVARCALCPGLLLTVLAVTGSAAAQDRAAAGDADAPGAPAAPGGQAAPAAPAAQAQKPVDGFKVGDFTFKPGGRVKLDIIRDFKPMDNEDSFDTRAIPIDAGDRTNSNLIAKETRLSIDIRGPAEGHELRMYVEGDFYGSSSAFRMRHAYGTWRGLLAGQTWSTFMDEDNLPRTIDFESPTAMAIIRQAQLRYTWKFGAASWAVAVEDNKSTIEVPDGVAGRAEFPSPDFVTRFRYDFSNGHIMASAFT